MLMPKSPKAAKPPPIHAKNPAVSLNLIAIILAVSVILTTTAHTHAQQNFSTPATAAVLLELDTNTILYAKNPDQALPPASLSKLATIYATLAAIQNNQYNLNDTFLVSEKAWRTGGSKMFVEVGKNIRIEDLLRGIIVSSGNDASIVIAEGLAGDEKSFAQLLNSITKNIGLKNSQFQNATGLPHPRHKMSALDVALISTRLIQDFPQYYPYFSEPEFQWSGIRQSNRNPLLGLDDFTVDGLKTGHTNAAGYSLAASAINENGRRLVIAILGLESTNQRRQEAERLLKWGFNNFTTHTLLKKGEVLGEAPVWLGKQPYIPLQIDETIRLTLSHADLEGMKAQVQYVGPVSAPVSSGQPLGTLKITFPSGKIIKHNLIAQNNVQPLSGASRINAALRYLVFGPEAVLDAAQKEKSP